MHADALPRKAAPLSEGYGKAVAYAFGLHVLLALLLWFSSWFSWQHESSSAAGLPVMDASLDATSAEIRATERALEYVPEPIPDPQPVEEVAEEDTVPPPQPIVETRPQDSPTPQQQVAQDRIPVPDTEDQDAASRLAISQEKALREQEAKRRQEQIDLTEQKRVEEAQKQQRLATQQEEVDKQKKLDEIRRLRAQAAKDAQLAEQKLRQLADARARTASAPPSPNRGPPSPPAGQNGNADDLTAKYVAAIQSAVTGQWNRPESVPVGTRCRVVIRQLPGGQVMSAEVQPGCAMDQAGQDSLERAVLKAQPLPYRGFESVFNRTLNFNFTAQER
ncbi:MAG TPA: cell envelope integrity protein TolA [Pseudoxanthomonas sp.]|nr:cell envelope integrity protein TolA [Pseudoxanthomonas sp.]